MFCVCLYIYLSCLVRLNVEFHRLYVTLQYYGIFMMYFVWFKKHSLMPGWNEEQACTRIFENFVFQDRVTNSYIQTWTQIT
jgi:hypothetical protein